MFADLITGNGVVVKPHPSAVLPLAITVEIARATLREAGFDPNLVVLVADEPAAPVAKVLLARPEIAIVDYTGSSSFGEWIEANAGNKLVYTEKAGVNAVVIDSTHDFKGLARNLALSLSLYSGQMCTTPQNVFVPRTGIETDRGPLGFDAVVTGLVAAVDGLLGAPERAVEILGAIATDATLARLDAEGAQSGVVLASRSVAHPAFENARVRTPLIVQVDAADRQRYGCEQFGPIAYVVATGSTQESLELATTMAREQGAITFVVYSTDRDVLVEAERLATDAGCRWPRPDRVATGQPVGGVQRLSRERRQPGGERVAQRRRFRRQPFPRRADAQSRRSERRIRRGDVIGLAVRRGGHQRAHALHERADSPDAMNAACASALVHSS